MDARDRFAWGYEDGQKAAAQGLSYTPAKVSRPGATRFDRMYSLGFRLGVSDAWRGRSDCVQAWTARNNASSSDLPACKPLTEGSSD